MEKGASGGFVAPAVLGGLSAPIIEVGQKAIAMNSGL